MGSKIFKGLAAIFVLFAMALPLAAQQVPSTIPGLVIWLDNARLDGFLQRKNERRAPYASIKLHGGDQGDHGGLGFDWFMQIDPGAAWSSQMMNSIPPGLVVGLKHTMNQRGMHIVAFNSVDVASTGGFIGFRRIHGGDRGAPSGEGFSWFESNGEGQIDWSLIDRLPKFTIMGLRHTMNLRPDQDYSLQIVWPGRHSCTYNGTAVPCDCTKTSITPPSGWARMGSLDRGAPSGDGFCWYEKRY